MCIVFIDIMAWVVSDIFSIFVFNNIMGLTFTFSPRVLSRLNRDNFIKSFIFKYIQAASIFVHYR